MASQSKGDPESGIETSKEDDKSTGSGSDRSIDAQTQQQQPAPFSEFDPFRAARTSAVRSETDRLLEPLQVEQSGFEDTTEAQRRQLYADAEERASWSKARSDAFISLLRLGKPIPSRGNRIL